MLEPRIGLSYEISPTSAVRVTYDRGVAFVPIASVGFGQVDPGYYINTPYGGLPAVNLLTGGGKPTADLHLRILYRARHSVNNSTGRLRTLMAFRFSRPFQ